MQRFSIRISGTHPSLLKTAGNDKTIYLVVLSRASHRKHLENVLKTLENDWNQTSYEVDERESERLDEWEGEKEDSIGHPRIPNTREGRGGR